MRINFKNLTVQVLIAIVIGILIGQFFPAFGIELKVLGDIFIKMVKMVIAPIVFFTIVVGFAGMGSMKKIGRIGGKALLYFEIITTFAMAIGVAVAYLVKPGSGIDISKVGDKASDVEKYTAQAAETQHSFVDFLQSIVPDNAIAAMSGGAMLPVLFFSVLFGLALSSLGEKGKPVVKLFELINEVFFKLVAIIMRFSPIAAGGAMAYTIGKFGIGSLFSLGKMMAATYMTMFLFIFIVLGLVAKFYNFSIIKMIKFIKDEILLVLGTSSSESALPRLMQRLEQYGCSKPVVGLVVPTGYSFNLDGTSIYLSMAAIFIAQAYGIELTWIQMLTFFGILMLTSKGAAGVTGSGFITLAATLTAIPGTPIPVEGIALLLGVDRFMSEARAITNLIGNSVATIVIAKSEKQFNVPSAASNEALAVERQGVHAESGSVA